MALFVNLSIFSVSAGILTLLNLIINKKGVITLKNKAIIIALILTLAGMGIWGKTNVLAQNTTPGPFSTLVQMIADKFNLNKNDVQQVFDQYKSDRQNSMQAQFEQKLDQAVKDGKITEEQKKLILAKHQELISQRQNQMQNRQNMTPEQRKAEMQNMQGKTQEERKTIGEAKKTKMETERKELEDWAKQNNIDPQYLFGGRRGHFGGMKGGWDMK